MKVVIRTDIERSQKQAINLSTDRQKSGIPKIIIDKSGAPPTSENDDYDLWDHNRMPPENTVCWKPSCIPISIVCFLIVLILLVPFVVDHKDKHDVRHAPDAKFCSNSCRIQLVESIPEGLIYPDGSPTFLSTFEAWKILLGLAKKSVNIGSFYWTLLGPDVINHTSAWQGEEIFQDLLDAGTKRKIKIRIAQSAPTKKSPNTDTILLAKQKAAEVRSVDFPRLLGGGVLHTKLWIVDNQHMYVGSANMDWRSLTQVKELGALVTNCSCLVQDVAKIFYVYWDMGRDKAKIPPAWPKDYQTAINLTNPILVNFNNSFKSNVYFASSPPAMSPKGRTRDIDAILNIIKSAEKFVHISVMDYLPLVVFSAKTKFWPLIDDALRRAAIENRVSVKLLISWWNHSRPAEDNFLRSLEDISQSYRGVNIEVKRFIVPATDDQARIPFGRVNHNKYMVTDKVAFIHTSNWEGDYFIDTAGIGFVLEDTDSVQNDNGTTIRNDLAQVFERDWNSPYAVDLQKY